MYENNEYYEEKNMSETSKGRKQRKISSKKLLFGAFFAVMVVLFLLSPFFSVKNIEVTEMERYTRDEILSMAGISEGMNIFAFSAIKKELDLEENTYFEKVNISRKFPNTLKIEIKERLVRGYVPYMGSYLYIDEYGRVLEISSGFTKQLPVVRGLSFDSFTIGEKIDADNTEAFNVMVIIAQMMTKYEVLGEVVEIDVSDTSKIMAYVGNIEINLGDISDCDRKIRTMGEIIKKIPEGDRGTLDLSDLSKPLVFKYLT